MYPMRYRDRLKLGIMLILGKKEYPMELITGFFFENIIGLYATINAEIDRCVFSDKPIEKMTPGEFKRKKLFVEKYGVYKHKKKMFNENSHPKYLSKQ